MQCEDENYVIAAAAGVHPSTLSQYARGHKQIAANHLIALCELFQCEPEELVGEMEVEIM
jgi:transcriptional regulator with XRE-family HTH domain